MPGPLPFPLSYSAGMATMTLPEFLRARAAELSDEETSDLLFNLASEYEEIDSDVVATQAMEAASWFGDHPDFKAEWTAPGEGVQAPRDHYVD